MVYTTITRMRKILNWVNCTKYIASEISDECVLALLFVRKIWPPLILVIVYTSLEKQEKTKQNFETFVCAFFEFDRSTIERWHIQFQLK